MEETCSYLLHQAVQEIRQIQGVLVIRPVLVLLLLLATLVRQADQLNQPVRELHALLPVHSVLVVQRLRAVQPLPVVLARHLVQQIQLVQQSRALLSGLVLRQTRVNHALPEDHGRLVRQAYQPDREVRPLRAARRIQGIRAVQRLHGVQPHRDVRQSLSHLSKERFVVLNILDYGIASHSVTVSCKDGNTCLSNDQER